MDLATTLAAGAAGVAELDPTPALALGVVAVAVLVAVAAFSRRLGIAAPILLVAVGVGISYLPGVPPVRIPGELVLDGLLPPILYAAAIRLPFADLRRNVGTIVSLSVVLVALTAFGTGFVLFALLPALRFSAGVALGAVISPPDAVSATAIGRRLGLPPRLLTVLEGEGLVNDATALVLFGTAIAVATHAAEPSVGGPLARFAYAVVVAVAIGLAVGWLTVLVRSRLDDPVLGTAVSLAVPFLAFVPTNAVGASGVLAVVVAGLFTGYRNPAAFSPVTRLSDSINWATIQFLLENGVFLLIGLQLRTIIEDVHTPDLSVPASFGLGLLLTAVLVLLRFLWVGPLVALLKLREQHAEAATLRALLKLQAHLSAPGRRPLRLPAPRMRRRYARRRADLDQLRAQSIDWRGGVVLGWSGMRGVVTLAAAQSLPADPAFPYRPQLVLIAFTVAVTTLVLQGTTLPGLIRVLGIRGVDEVEDRRLLAGMLDELSFVGLSVLDDPEGALGAEIGDVPPEVLDRVRESSSLRAESAWERSHADGLPLEATPHRLYRRLRLAVVQAEREHLLDLRRRGTYPPRIEAEAQALLDLEEARLRPTRPGY